MRYRELFEQAPSDGLFFHVTTPRRVKKILQTGIEPNHQRRWNNYTGKKLGDRGFVYLISDFTAAVRWAAKVQWEMGKGGERDKTPIDILCVRNIDPTSLEPDTNLEGQLNYPGKWFQMKGTIGPENIVRIISLTPELIKQVVNGGTASIPA